MQDDFQLLKWDGWETILFSKVIDGIVQEPIVKECKARLQDKYQTAQKLGKEVNNHKWFIAQNKYRENALKLVIY